MAKKTLTIEGLGFPKFSANSSKKNFRLIFYISFLNEKNEVVTKTVSKPDSGEWQWKSDKDRYFIAEKTPPPSTDSVELDVGCLRKNEEDFTELDYQIADIDGTLQSVVVHILDVHDISFGEVLLKIGQELAEDAIKLGLEPFKIPGTVLNLILKGVKASQMAEAMETQLKEMKKDKLLFRGAKAFKSGNSLVIEGRKRWEENKKGTYKVVIGFE